MPKRYSYSFPKTCRLTRASEFQRVKRDGSVRRGKLILLGFLRMNNESSFRAGFIVSRDVGSAAVRNRIRRRLREIVRRHQHRVRRDLWMVIIATSNAKRATYQVLEDEWLRLAERASILTPDDFAA